MTLNLQIDKLNQKRLWYMATVLGFTCGLMIGTWFVNHYKPSTPGQASWMELFFWIFPAGGAGLGMGFGQSILLRRVHKYTYLWILATTIGVIVIMGGALLVFAVTSSYSSGRLTWLYSNLPGWFVPLTYITPIIIFTGPFFQWLLVSHFRKSRSLKELLKLSLGWIVAIIVLLIMLGLLTLMQSRIGALNLLAGIVATIPTGLIFAYFTRVLINKPQSDKGSLLFFEHHPGA